MHHDERSQQHAAANLWGLLLPLGEALRFLTLLPLPGLPASSERGIARAIGWFPLAGGVIGVLLLPVGWLTGMLWGADVRAAALVVVWAIITAGLHLDGLADTFDGVMSWRSREQKLQIMKDSSTGAMGTLALAAVLLLKFAWLQAAGDNWWAAIMLAVAWGRWAQVYGLAWFPAARPDGLGHTFRASTRSQGFWFATVTAATLALLFGQGQGLLAGVLVWGLTYLLARWWVRLLGGLTGDTYGALCEIGEVAALAVLTV
jgi:adenosylcobinamide-GDP ribazoletransferase